MIAISVTIEDTTKKVVAAADKAAFRNFGHAAARISKDAKASLDKAPQGVASAPGTPPHTHRGVFFRRAIRFAADKTGAVIGPRESIVGEAGAAHEFGEEFRGADYPERSYMKPALDKNISRFASDWAGSIGE